MSAFMYAILTLMKIIGPDLTNVVVEHMRNITFEPQKSCLICGLSWCSLTNELFSIRYLYPVIIWKYRCFDIDYTCSKTCQITYNDNERKKEEMYRKNEKIQK